MLTYQRKPATIETNQRKAHSLLSICSIHSIYSISSINSAQYTAYAAYMAYTAYCIYSICSIYSHASTKLPSALCKLPTAVENDICIISILVERRLGRGPHHEQKYWSKFLDQNFLISSTLRSDLYDDQFNLPPSLYNDGYTLREQKCWSKFLDHNFLISSTLRSDLYDDQFNLPPSLYNDGYTLVYIYIYTY